MKETYNFVFMVKYSTSSYTQTKKFNVYNSTNEKLARLKLDDLVKKQSKSANIISAECIAKYSREY